VGPSFAIPLSALEEKKEKEDEKDKKLSLPGAAPRPIGTQERIVPLASYQTSRIPELAREALSVRAFLYLHLPPILHCLICGLTIYHVLLTWTMPHLAGGHPISNYASLAPNGAPARAGKAHLWHGHPCTMELR
jgi:hypothetical protein